MLPYLQCALKQGEKVFALFLKYVYFIVVYCFFLSRRLNKNFWRFQSKITATIQYLKVTDNTNIWHIHKTNIYWENLCKTFFYCCYSTINNITITSDITDFVCVNPCRNIIVNSVCMYIRFTHCLRALCAFFRRVLQHDKDGFHKISLLITFLTSSKYRTFFSFLCIKSESKTSDVQVLCFWWTRILCIKIFLSKHTKKKILDV